MGKKNQDDARRAKKKHQKALRRARQLARRRERQAHLHRERHARLEDPLAGWVPQVEGVQGLALRLDTQYVVAARLVEHRADLPKELWTPRRIRALPTEELIGQLEALGLEASEARFRETFALEWALMDAVERVWLPRLAAESTVHVRDFVCMAALELHERWMPGQSSREALIRAFLDSLDAVDAQQDERAVERGLSLWRLLRPRLRDDMRLPEDVDGLLGLRESFSGWPVEFATCALNAVRWRPELGAPAAEVLDEMVTHFTEEHAGWRLALLGDRARLLDAAGRQEEAERLLRRLMAEHPDAAVGYVVLADLLSRPGADASSRARALVLLEAAAARPVRDGAAWDLRERIQALREEVRAPSPA